MAPTARDVLEALTEELPHPISDVEALTPDEATAILWWDGADYIISIKFLQIQP